MNKEMMIKAGVLLGKALMIGASTIVTGHMQKKTRDASMDISNNIERGIKHYIEEREERKASK